MITITLPTLTLHEGNMAEEGNCNASGTSPVVPSTTDSLPTGVNALHLDVESGKASEWQTSLQSSSREHMTSSLT